MIPVSNWDRTAEMAIACGLLGDGWLSFINEALERVDPRGERALEDARDMFNGDELGAA